jgi:predicted transposase/invertase (TIGR01784 family)
MGKQVSIVELLESESNQDNREDKYNRVDIKAKDSHGEIIIVEIQLTREWYYRERILCGLSESVMGHISLDKRYNQIKKIYFINILYFDLGQGKDYLYRGKNTFTGVHTHDTLQVNTKEDRLIRYRTPESIFPEYYIIRVNEFNSLAKTPLEEWIDYLKSGRIKEDTKTPGLQEAREKLQYLTMSREDRLAYDRYIDAIMVQNDVLDTAKLEGRAEGLAEVRAEGKLEIARNMKHAGLDMEQISLFTGLSVEKIEEL